MDKERLLYSINDAVTALGISRSVLYELIAAGDIRPVKIGTRTLIPHAELENYVQRLISTA